MHKKRNANQRKWYLILIDDAPLRNNVVREFCAIKEEIDKCTQRLNHFAEKDQAPYVAWLEQTFGSVLAEIKKIEGELDKKTRLLNEVAAAFSIGEFEDFDAAYQAVLEKMAYQEALEKSGKTSNSDQRESDEEAEANLRVFFASESAKAGVNVRGMSKNEYAASFSRFKERIFDDMKGMHDGKSSVNSREDSRLKDTYRTLVRWLHPDRHKKIDTQINELWHSVQEAYVAGDIEQLETLLALTELMGLADEKNSPLSSMRQALEKYQMDLQTVRAQIKRAKKDPAWGFSEKDRISLREKAGIELSQTLSRLKETFKEVEFMVSILVTTPKTELRKKQGRR